MRSGTTALARGLAEPPPSREAPEPASPRTGWLRYARRAGSVVLDVALLGQRAAPGFPANLWVRATDAASHAPIAGAAISLESDTSLVLAPTAAGTTDSRGWARIVATPVGLAVTTTLVARSSGGGTGEWNGGLFMSPGAPEIVGPDRVEPEAPILARRDHADRAKHRLRRDRRRAGTRLGGRRVACGRADGASRVDVEAPGFAPGLYWAVAAADPASAAGLGAGTIARPFFVAPSDDGGARLRPGPRGLRAAS